MTPAASSAEVPDTVRWRGGRRSGRALLAVVACVAFVAVPVPAAGQLPAEPAIPVSQPIYDVERHFADSVNDSDPNKSVEVYCPAGKVPLSGGGQLIESGLTRRLAFQSMSFLSNGYRVTGVEVSPGVSGNWRVRAHVICALRPPGYGLWPVGSPGGGPMEYARSDCPFDRVVLGVGAYIPGLSPFEPDQVGLRQVMASTNGTYAYARASELAGGAGVHGESWYVVVTAACADRPWSYENKRGTSAQNMSEPSKEANAHCSTGRRLIGAGGSVNTLQLLDVSLMHVLPDAETKAWARGVENGPVDQNWGTFTAHATCATVFDIQ
jgi:hypothetical protein